MGACECFKEPSSVFVKHPPVKANTHKIPLCICQFGKGSFPRVLYPLCQSTCRHIYYTCFKSAVSGCISFHKIWPKTFEISVSNYKNPLFSEHFKKCIVTLSNPLSNTVGTMRVKKAKIRRHIPLVHASKIGKLLLPMNY